ncbi:hypothetical protein I6N95_11470 [Vagococcus sp. BWB3-3]|uniref:Uncharacterized protein n=1 Tax=Vagococcus allomyrinae TaxID=2794353 RepID=A0A940P8H8_9ENTE|nr:hypothetical protein [Vagococcus allomyrinae]MBP1041626.1 hypothetical protein [Vagococcus allomyrinae]
MNKGNTSLLILLMLISGLGAIFWPAKEKQLTSVKSVIYQIDGHSHINFYSIKLLQKDKGYLYEVIGQQHQQAYRWQINDSSEVISQESITIAANQENSLLLDKNILIQNLSIIAEMTAGKGVATSWQLTNEGGRDLWKIGVTDGVQHHDVIINNNTLAIEAVKLI